MYKIFYPTLIFLTWLAVFIVCSVYFEQKFEWDEIKYLACAKGIAENLDFSSRSTSVLGLIKYGYPQNTTHYPLHSAYIALFFKLFGASINIAYFSTWFCALLTCIFIYLTSLLLTENNRRVSFFVSLSFLFFPKVLNYCHSVMMEVPGCALLSFLVYVIVRSFLKGKTNPFLMALAVLWLYLYKSLFIGVIFGFIAIIIFKFRSYFKLILFLGMLFLLYFIFTKFVFLPVAPWIVFLPEQEGVHGAYADFLGGFLNNIPANLLEHISIFFEKVVLHYYPFLVYKFFPIGSTFYPVTQYWFETGIYFIVLFYTAVFSFFIKEKLLPIQKLFILFSIVSIVVFNIILISITGCSGLGLLYRYSLIYFPLLLISLGIILERVSHLQSHFISKYKKRIYFLILSFVFIIYTPLYFCSDLIIGPRQWLHDVMKKNSLIVKGFIGKTKPEFIYCTLGTNITWDLFPIREIFMEATNEQISKINSILPKPIEYLFLNPSNYLFKENFNLISKRLPIVNNWYTFYGIDEQNQVVVYKLNSKTL